MKNLVQYKKSVETLFLDFCGEKINLRQFITELKMLQEYHRNLTRNFTKEMWFQFGKQDNLATDIYDLEQDLEGGKNKEFTLERMKNIANIDLLIYFS